jgi:DNA-binding MarR family transcriptional regulator
MKTDSKAPHRFYHAETYRPQESVGYLVQRLAQTVAREVDHRMAKLGLTEAQWKPLLLLSQGSCVTAADISRLACQDTGAVTRLLDRLEAKKLIRRVRSADDRRVVRLELTREGERVAAELPKILAGLVNEMLTGFSQEEFGVFKALLERALANVQSLGGEGGAS